MNKIKVERGSHIADQKFKVVVTEKGPYLIYGSPPLTQEFILPNEEGASWIFRKGRTYSTANEPTALCRCGASHKKPYCDGSHLKAEWNPQLTSPIEVLLDNVEITRGDDISLTDNQKYCTFARFCDAKGRVWNLTQNSSNPEKSKLAQREASICPGGRLMAWNNLTEEPFEYKYAPELALIEDPAIGASGGVWVKGGIKISREDGSTYEVRNRVVLCRCGASSNKPYCDGTHAAIKFNDALPNEATGDVTPHGG